MADPFTVPQPLQNPMGPDWGPTNINPWGVSQGPQIIPQPQAQQTNSAMQIPMPDAMQDPYAASISAGQSQLAGYTNAYNTAQPGMQSGINQGNAAVNAYGQQSSAYPSYPNAAGAGSQTAGMGIAQAQVAPMMGSGQQGAGTMQITQDTTTGFSPWSLQGEALSRK